MATTINASTSAGLVSTADLTGTLQLQSNGVTQQTIDSTGSYGQLKLATSQTTTSGTAITFSSIPSWVKRITVIFNGVSLSGTSNYLIQVGAGSVTSSGYTSACNNGAGTITTSTAGFLVTSSSSAADLTYGSIVINTPGSNAWIQSSILNNGNATRLSAGFVSLSGTLDRVVITTVNGTDTFDAGSINIMYEG